MTTIQEYVNERGIRFLTHFTRVSSLDSILNHGLVTRDVLVREGSIGVCNDQYRLDGTNAICLSIAFPNYKMFWGVRKDNPNVDWVILAISPRVLWQLRCAFCVANAASAGVTAIPLQNRMTLASFKGMYGDFGEKSRSQLGLDDEFPTNPQAEVLMLDGVPIQYILGVSVLNTAMQKQLEAKYPGLDVRVHPAYYSYRSDYAHWK